MLLPGVTVRLAVEAGVSLGWERWVGDGGRVISVDKFGASAPYQIIFTEYGITVDHIVTSAREMMTSPANQPER